jgi:hypothetical protein
MNANNYINELLSQGQGNLNICPECFARGQRKYVCANMVYLIPENVLVCCYLGDKHELPRMEFRKKVRDMKRAHGVAEKGK